MHDYFFKLLDLNNQKYQRKGTVRHENYKGKLLCIMKDLVLFEADIQSMFFMSTILFKENIDGVHVP